MTMGKSTNFIFGVLVASALALSACGSSGSKGGTGGQSGTGGAGGSTIDAGGGTGGAGAGDAGADGVSARDEHLLIINKQTTGGVPVTRPAPVAYDTCKN
jgi:hypothetical protein